MGLIPRYDESIEVMKKVGQMAYKLKLPKRLKLHLMFYVNFLKPYHEDPNKGKIQIKWAPPLLMKQFDQDLEKILDHRTLGQARKIVKSIF